MPPTLNTCILDDYRRDWGNIKAVKIAAFRCRVVGCFAMDEGASVDENAWLKFVRVKDFARDPNAVAVKDLDGRHIGHIAAGSVRGTARFAARVAYCMDKLEYLRFAGSLSYGKAHHTAQGVDFELHVFCREDIAADNEVVAGIIQLFVEDGMEQTA
jgi:hypothetical protein